CTTTRATSTGSSIACAPFPDPNGGGHVKEGRGALRVDRRAFARLGSAGMLGAWAAPLAGAESPREGSGRRALMTVGTQHGSSNEVLALLATLGVNHI